MVWDVLAKSCVFSFGWSSPTRTKWQASVTRELFLGQYLVPAKLHALNSRVQDKLYETHKIDLSEKRDFDNEILRWQTKWPHSTDEKPVTHLTETVSSTLIQTFIPTWSQLLTSSWQCQCQLLPPNDLLAWWAEWRRTYVPRRKQSDLP